MSINTVTKSPHQMDPHISTTCLAPAAHECIPQARGCAHHWGLCCHALCGALWLSRSCKGAGISGGLAHAAICQQRGQRGPQVRGAAQHAPGEARAWGFRCRAGGAPMDTHVHALCMHAMKRMCTSSCALRCACMQGVATWRTQMQDAATCEAPRHACINTCADARASAHACARVRELIRLHSCPPACPRAIAAPRCHAGTRAGCCGHPGVIRECINVAVAFVGVATTIITINTITITAKPRNGMTQVVVQPVCHCVTISETATLPCILMDSLPLCPNPAKVIDLVQAPCHHSFCPGEALRDPANFLCHNRLVRPRSMSS